jgi:phosphate transport system permease protein
MTGVPSIVMGLFVYVVFTLRFGLSGLGGSLALACLMLPVVIRSSEEMLRLVPDHLREASYALGAHKSRTILTVVLPTALPGVVSGSLLAVARAAGETAPLLFTIGAAKTFNWNVFKGPNTTLSYQIFGNAGATLPGPIERGWGAAFTLVSIAFAFTVVARLVTKAYQRRR